MRSGALIVNYHRITRRSGPAEKYLVSERMFDRQLHFFERHFEIVSLDSLLRRLQTGLKTAGRLLSITFDDGYKEHYDTVLPVLEQRRIKATFFIVAGNVGGKAEWLPDAAELCSWANLHQMASAGHGIESHGFRHLDLTILPRTELLNELASGKEEVETRLGRESTILSYPFGRNDERVRTALTQTGFRAGCTTRRRLIHSGIDVLQLPRVNMHERFTPLKLRRLIARLRRADRILRC